MTRVTVPLAGLLTADRLKRIGCLKSGAEDIKKHKWFRGLNWAALYNKQMEAASVNAFVPTDGNVRCTWRADVCTYRADART